MYRCIRIIFLSLQSVFLLLLFSQCWAYHTCSRPCTDLAHQYSTILVIALHTVWSNFSNFNDTVSQVFVLRCDRQMLIHLLICMSWYHSPTGCLSVFKLFEGMKAYCGQDGKIRLFRPSDNFERMLNSARRACLPTFDSEEMRLCLHKFVETEKDWVPQVEGCSLYLRPTMIGTEVRYLSCCQHFCLVVSHSNTNSVLPDHKINSAIRISVYCGVHPFYMRIDRNGTHMCWWNNWFHKNFPGIALQLLFLDNAWTSRTSSNLHCQQASYESLRRYK